MVIVGIKYLISMKYREMNGLQLLDFKTLIEAVNNKNKSQNYKFYEKSFD